MIDKFNRNHDTEQRKKVLNPKCVKQHIEAKSQKNGTDNRESLKTSPFAFL